MQSVSRHRQQDQIDKLKSISPELYATLDFARIAARDDREAEILLDQADDFAASAAGGRGELYRDAQKNSLVRAMGIQTLCSLVSPGQQLNNLSPAYKILDVLGGDGLLTRALQRLLPPNLMPSILTSDLSEGMIDAAQTYGLAAFQQPAQHLLMHANSFDAVILAYGTHHIPLHQRLQACREAWRVIKPNGRILLHDFASDSPVATWFHTVVDRYARTGHHWPHFSSQEMHHYLLEAGFENISIQQVYDPFILFAAAPGGLEQELGAHLLNMYGLVGLLDEPAHQPAWRIACELAREIFRYNYQEMGLPSSFGAAQIQCTRNGEQWSIEMPRVALVGTASKKA